jgi:hypothetical protein
MNDTVKTATRYILTALGSVAAGMGYVEEQAAMTFVGAGLAFAAASVGLYESWRRKQAEREAAKSPLNHP